MSMTLVLAFSLAKFMSVVLGIFPAMLDIFDSELAFLYRCFREWNIKHACPSCLPMYPGPSVGSNLCLNIGKKSQTFDRKIDIDFDIESIMSVWKLVRVCRPGMTCPGVSISAYPYPRVTLHVPLMIFRSPRAPSCLTNRRGSSDSEDTGNLAMWSRECIC